MAQKPDAVVFDIGNVLVNWSPDQLYAELLPDPAARNRLFEAANLNAMNEQIDLGAPFRETIYAEADRHAKNRDLIRAWHDRWIEMFAPGIEGSWDILRRLRKDGVRVLALSNFGRESFEIAQAAYPVLTEFDRQFISGHMGVIKPDPRIYQMVEEETGLAGASLFFIDDRVENIEAAQARGWQGHVFSDPQRLAHALTEVGLL